ncbi:hypothetical protein BDZ90DRAFT_61352 [Jaminaea rosea]|uniref:Serine/threonine-protein kinase Tel1 n=1 Tax=Jaminaea rosea TaxID=1569628 RepID=A0A316UKE2_9BASI|nr:hypothetical protein BDZ90DRAFT_61352 [Jaminaea rosea]PWN25736.1 hypothetical protein BDZ90DRAFT_61352 [Jaminaea rosea]
MSASSSLQAAIESISSERVSDRTAGLAAYSDIFSRNRVLRDLRGKDKVWISVFQAHFQCVVLEKEACFKKGGLASATAVSVNRLKAAAASLRWLVARSVQCFQRQTAKPLLNHLVQMLSAGKELLSPIALDYLRALHVLLSHRGHRNSVDVHQWSAIASLCFNAVLTRPLNADLPLVDFRSVAAPTCPSKRALGLEDIEVMSCLEELMASPIAPLNDQRDKMGLRLLAAYGCFLQSFPTESTAHLPALAGLNELLREIEFNQSQAMRSFAFSHWEPLCQLWDSKNKTVKEQLVVAFRILLPYLASQDDEPVRGHLAQLLKRLDGDGENRFSLGPLNPQQLSLRLEPQASSPFRTPFFSAGRTFSADSAVSWAALELCADVTATLIERQGVELVESSRTEDVPVDDDEPTARSGTRKRAPPRARAASRPLSKTTQSPLGTRDNTASPSKRLRLDESARTDPLTRLIDSLAQAPGATLAKARSNRLWRLQMTCFLIGRHYTTALDAEQQQRLATRIIDLLSDGDHELQGWAFICLASLLSQPTNLIAAAIPSLESTWTLCCRRIQVAAVSRQAALAAHALLQSNLLDKHRYLHDLKTLFSDLDLAAPPFPFDSVCDLFASALDLCATDVAMAKSPCRNQVAAWLASVWAPAAGIERGFRARERIEEHDSSGLNALLSRICQLRPVATQQPVMLLPGNAVVEQMGYEDETRDLRNFLLTAALSYEAKQDGKEATREQSEVQDKNDTPLRPLQGTEQRITSLLKRAIDVLSEQWRPSSSPSEEGPSLMESASVDQARRTLDVIATTLLFQATLTLGLVEANMMLTAAAHSLLRTIMTAVSERSRWSVSSRSTLLVAIAPLVGPQVRVSNDVSSLLKALVKPGPCSGVRQDTLSLQSVSEDRCTTSSDPVLHTIWTSAPRDAQKAFLKALQRCLHTICDMPGGEEEATQQGDDDDEWGQARQATSESDEIMKPAKDYGSERFALTASIALCVNGLVEVARITESAARANPLMDDVLLDGPIVAFDRAAPAVFAAYSRERLILDDEVLASIIDRLGNEYLNDYEFKFDEDALMNVINFCEASMAVWLPGATPSSSKSTGGQLSMGANQFNEYFARSLFKGKPMSWRARVRAAAYLEVLLRSTSTRDWTDNGDDDVLCSTSLLLIIYGLMQEGDIRVRFAAATMIARLFDCVPTDSESDLYDKKLLQILTSDWDDFEGTLTRLLTLSNVMIRSSPLRAAALFNIIEPFGGRERGRPYLPHAKALFAAVSDNLGFSAPTDLFRVFAAQIAFGLDSMDSDPTRLPWSVLGYDSAFHCLQYNFMGIGSMMAAIAVDKPEVLPRFGDLARSFGKTMKEAVAECLPVVAAIQLVIEVSLAEQSSRRIDQLLDSAPILSELQQRLTSGVTTVKALETTFALSLDRVIVETLSQFAEEDLGSDCVYHAQLQRADPRVAQELTALSNGVEVNSKSHAHVPHRPIASGFQVYQTIAIATAELDPHSERSLAYHVIHQMLSLIWRERLVNDQLRHLHALRLFIAMKREGVASSLVLLRALLHGCSLLMGQPDLLALSSGIAAWCIQRCIEIDKSPPQLSSILIAMAEGARDEATFEWLASRVLLPLVEAEGTRKHAFVAICAYPRRLPVPLVSSLTRLDLHLNLAALTEVLVRHSKVSLNLHLLIRFRDALREAQQSDVFARSTIWHLFDRLNRQPSAESAYILGDILSALHDKIQTPSAEQYQASEETLGNPNANLTPLVLALSRAEKPYEPIKIFIALKLLELQRGVDLHLAERAFHSLRAILTQEADLHMSTGKWPDLMTEELALLSHYSTAPAARQSSHVDCSLRKVDARKFDDWIRSIATSLCDRLSSIVTESFFAQMRELVAAVASFASNVFIPLLHAYLYLTHDSGDMARETASLADHLGRILKDDDSDRQSWATIINALIYLRKQELPVNAGRSSDHWLPVDYLLLARRAIDCQLYSTALLWIELEREHQSETWAQAAKQEQVSQLLYSVYSNIEDPDSFYGVHHKDLRGSLVRRLHHEEEWRRAFELHAADYECGGSAGSEAAIAQSLHQMGFNKLASSMDAVYADYEVAWRTEDWSLPTDRDPQPGNGVNVFAALRALHQEQDDTVIGRTISQALASEARALSGAGVEAVSQIRRVCRDLMSLSEAWRWNHSNTSGEQNFSADLRLDFDDFERITTVRQSLLRSQRYRIQASQIGDLLEPATEEALKSESRLLLNLCRAARKQDRQQAAMNAVTRAQKLCKHLAPSARPADLTPEFASVLWNQGEEVIAIQALSEEIEALPQSATSRDDRLHKAKLLAELGHWRATARSQQPREIDDHLFRPAHALVKEDETSAECAAVCNQYAVFADDQYRALRNAAEVQQLEAFVSHRQEELRQNKAEMSRVDRKSEAYKNLHSYRSQAEKILRQDEALLSQHITSREFFLLQAFKMYASAMRYASEYDGSIVRLTSLWFENAGDEKFNGEIRQALSGMPPHKFLPLTHQLSSRLGSDPRSFSTNVSIVMKRMCQAHPFHSLYAIYALRKADQDSSPQPSTAAKKKASAGTKNGNPSDNASPASQRAAAAHDLWHTVKASSPHKARVVAFENACDAYVEWAELNLRRSVPNLFHGNAIKSGSFAFPSQENLPLKIKQLPSYTVPVATADLPVDPSGAYRNMVTIERYSDLFTTAGGIHLPKITDCIGSNGERYKQLFKSDDDLRQDAVMQQVFRLLNELLIRDRKAAQRHLRIRTYAVLPLGPQCGLLEFVQNTCPIGEVLVDAHHSHHTEGQWSPGDARSCLAAVMGKTPYEKLEAYRAVCRNMPPAFRHYFMEQFKNPPTWLAVRLNYTRSVATTSIIGHVLGLGDRHVSNILMDKKTGEVIHIDFGVAFEQGRLLPIPELVPFRLTRDIVDGMGLSGVEGVFRRCCEETLRVLRGNKDVIQTVLEVFKYDPLFAWTSNPVKILQAQGAAATGPTAAEAKTKGGRVSTPGTASGSRATISPGGGDDIAGRDTASLSAERAIGTVLSKLSTGLSVQTTVTELIGAATDEGNLSAIFHGWQAGM